MGTRTLIDVATTFADSAKYISIWKWENGGWAVRLPKDGDGGAAYATGKGFGLLADLKPGEGFWVNSAVAVDVPLAGQPVADAPLTLAPAWNLVSLKAGTAQEVATLVGNKAASVTSLWKWENGKWAVRLPGDGDGGAAYATGKGFGLLELINPGEGFWVNAASALTLP